MIRREMLLGCVVVMISGCERSGPSLAQRQHLRSLDIAQAESDARHAASRGDYALLGIGGVGTYVPGIPDGMRLDYLSPSDVRIIHGTSDMISDDEHRALQNKARNYAKRYNETMVTLRRRS
ncbi:hypothetical protein [Caulobacter mirabilis]|uniref:hypothetical protein n=1 Tax=Caulobacter mirabilis TaxID=69666 RepID=UPI0012373797|nr:hypothetical protein [Caulobacter mirabilis]